MPHLPRALSLLSRAPKPSILSPRGINSSLRASTTSSSVFSARSLHASARNMSVEASMRKKLQESFAPKDLQIRNDSSKHAHHAAMRAQNGGNGETHFFVDIVSQAFEGKPQIARHRAINALLADEFAQGLHALSLRTRTPAEVERDLKRQAGGA